MARIELTKYPAIPPAVLTVKQAALYLQVSTDTIYNLCKQGRLLHQRIGRAIRIKQADLDQIEPEVKDDW